jgi:hypothetical protein
MWEAWTRKRAATGTEEEDVQTAVQLMARRCLCCGHSFEAEGRFNRVCAPSKVTVDWRPGDPDDALVAA